MSVDPADQRQSLRRAEGNRVVVVQRVPKAERAAERLLRELGLVGVGPAAWRRRAWRAAGRSSARAGWSRTGGGSCIRACRGCARRAGGSRSTRASAIRWSRPTATGRPTLGETGNAWFSFDLGVMVEGERVPLLPVLAEALRHLTARARGIAEMAEATLLRQARRTAGCWPCRPTASGRCWRRWSSCSTPRR